MKHVPMNPVAPNKSDHSRPSFLRRVFGHAFRRDEHGAVAIEFALLALPFFAIIGAIFETSLYFLSSQILDSAVDTSVRLVRTGQAQTADYTASQFRDSICDNLLNLFTCENLQVDVETINDFSSADFSISREIDPDTGLLKGTWIYSPGTGSDYVMLRVGYKWPTMLDILGFNLSNIGDGYRLMTAVRVFRNEPFT